LTDLINCAREKYLEIGLSKVTVHLADSTSFHDTGDWGKTITKPRRPVSTLILPSNVKEMILGDAREFLASEAWYNAVGIPHRRGELL
ncbi:hypothetical protein DFH07DRAFT_699229, partial [Mycena maculata]